MPRVFTRIFDDPIASANIDRMLELGVKAKAEEVLVVRENSVFSGKTVVLTGTLTTNDQR